MHQKYQICLEVNFENQPFWLKIFKGIVFYKNYCNYFNQIRVRCSPYDSLEQLFDRIFQKLVAKILFKYLTAVYTELHPVLIKQFHPFMCFPFGFTRGHHNTLCDPTCYETPCILLPSKQVKILIK